MENSFLTFFDWEDHIKNFFHEEGEREVKLNLLHVNIRSLPKHWDEFNVYISNRISTLDVIVLTEVNVDEKDIAGYHLQGFDSFSLCREGRKGGGVLIFLKDCWLADRMDVQFNYAEVVVLSIHKNSDSYILVAMYRPPSTNLHMLYDEMTSFFNSFGNDLLILTGDMNIDISDQKKHGVRDYLDLLSAYGLENQITSFTREEYLGNKLTKSCLDHIVVRLSNQIHVSGVIKQKLSDHYFITMVVLGENIKEATKNKSRKKLILDNNLVDRYIREQDWDALLKYDHEAAYLKFADIFKNIYRNSVKEVKIKQRKMENVWITDEILELCLQKDLLWKRCKNNRSDEGLKQEFRIMRNLVTAKVKLAKNRYYNNKFDMNQGNQRKTWETINQLIGKHNKLSIEEVIRKHFGDSISCKQLCEDFNDTFIKLVENLKQRINTQSQESLTHTSQANSAYLPLISDLQLEEIISSMSISKPAGADEIRLRDIRYNVYGVKPVLLHILNGILTTGKIPQGLKTAVIRPIYKQGVRNKVENYRPVSILPVISHILEKYLLKVMSSFSDKFEILNDSQYGFRPGKSTTQLLEDISDFLNESLDTNNFVLALFLDLKKAFDTIDHKIMIKKLNNAGFRGPFLNLLQDFFKERRQFVKIGDNKSREVTIKYGVPQGSSLSPMLFNLYVNDVHKINSHGKILQYADDTVLLLSHSDIQEATRILQIDIHKLVKWFADNHIFVNVEKTKLICFRNPHKQVQLNQKIFIHPINCKNCQCHPLEFEKTTKYLGLVFDEHLSWNQHAEFISRKLRTVSGYLYRIRSATSVKMRQTIFKALGESVMRYGISVYGSCAPTTKEIINRTLRRIARNIAYGTNFQTLETIEKMQALDIPTVEQLFRSLVLITHYYSDKYKIKIIRKRQLRFTETYYIPRIFTNYGKRLRKYYIPSIFNTLPSDTLKLTSIKQVKQQMRDICLGMKI